MDNNSLICRQSILGNILNLIFSISLFLISISLYCYFKFYKNEIIVSYILISLSIVLFINIMWIYLSSINTIYSVNEIFLKINTGVLNKNLDTIDLVKVQSIVLKRSLFDRVLNISKVHIYTSDKLHKHVILKGITKENSTVIFNIINHYATGTYVEYKQHLDYERKKGSGNIKQKFN